VFGLELVGQHGVIDLALLHIAMALRDDLRAGRADDAVYDESLARPGRSPLAQVRSSSCESTTPSRRTLPRETDARH